MADRSRRIEQALDELDGKVDAKDIARLMASSGISTADLARALMAGHGQDGRRSGSALGIGPGRRS